MRTFLTNFFFDTFTKNVAKILSGTLVGQGFLLVITPVLTRVYSPHSFGVFALYFAIISIAAVIGAFCLELAIPLPEQDLKAAHVCVGALFYTALFSILCIAGILIAKFYIIPAREILYKLEFFVWLVPLGSFIVSVYMVLTYWLIRKKRFTVLASIKIYQGFSQGIVQLLLGILGLGVLGLIIGQAVAQSIGAVGIMKSIKKYDLSSFKSVTLQGVMRSIKQFKKFPLLTAPASSLNAFATYLPAISFSFLFGLKQTGYFSLAWQSIAIPFSLLGTAASKVFVSSSANLINQNRLAVKKLYIKTVFQLFLIALIPVLILFIWGPSLFSFIFSGKWEVSGFYAQALAITFLVRFPVYVTSKNLIILGRQGLDLAWNFVSFSLIASVFVCSFFYKLTPYLTVQLFSCASLISYLSLFIINYIFLKCLK